MKVKIFTTCGAPGIEKMEQEINDWVEGIEKEGGNVISTQMGMSTIDEVGTQKECIGIAIWYSPKSK